MNTEEKNEVLNKTLKKLKAEDVVRQFDAFMPGNYQVRAKYSEEISQVNEVKITTDASLNQATLNEIQKLRHKWEFSMLDIKRSGVGLTIIMKL